MTEPHGDPAWTISMLARDRAGEVEYRDGDRVLEIPYEPSATDGARILLAAVDARRWTEPAGVPIDPGTQLAILDRVRAWLAREGIPSDLDRPRNPPLDREPCASRGCERRRMRRSAFCPQHYDLELLRRD